MENALQSRGVLGAAPWTKDTPLAPAREPAGADATTPAAPGAAGDRLVLRPGAAHSYCVGLITPASMAGDCVWPISRAQHPRHTGGVRYAVPSLAGGSAALYVCSVRKQWVEDFRYRALGEKSGKTLIGVEQVCFNPGRFSGLAA